MDKPETTIAFTTDNDETIMFSVISETKLNGINYLLVTEEENDDETYILKESKDEGNDIVYEIIDNDEELRIIADVFEEILEDVEIE